MSVEGNRDYAYVRQIASVCDRNWFNNLNGANKNKAISDCARRVEELTKNRIVCGALFFENVDLRMEGKVKPNQTNICITTDKTNAPKDSPIFVLKHTEAEFHLLSAGEISHVKISPKEKNIFFVKCFTQNSRWNVSVSQVEEIVEKNWTNSLVIAYKLWTDVIPVPGIRGESDEKDAFE